MLKKTALLSLFVLNLVVLSTALEEDAYAISLGSVDFTPVPGRVETRGEGHFILQFQDIPTESQLEDLERQGIEVQRYLGGNAYIARYTRKPDSGFDLSALAFVRSAVEITAAMRRAPELGAVGHAARHPVRGRSATYDVRFHPDVPFSAARDVLIAARIGCPRSGYMSSHRIVIDAERAAVEALLHADAVDRIEPALQDYKLLTWGGAKRMRVEQILRKPVFRAPDGSGVVVGITDAWTVDPAHRELSGRVTVLHDTSYMETPTDWADLNHATAVAGNLAASGEFLPRCRGSAPSASILSMVVPYDPVNEILYAARNLGLRISSNSWGYGADTILLPPARLETAASSSDARLKTRWGYYPNFNYATDQMVRKADVLYFWAAGNESYAVVLAPILDEMNNLRNPDDWHRAHPVHDTMLVNPSAKNVLAIGATHKDDVICAFSSRGPGYGGRLGPHLVAPGFDMLTLSSGDEYAFGSGTSGSCPLAAGVAALLIDQYRKIHQVDPSARLIRALLFNSARDLGLAGPDYTFGYGMVDAQLAARTISGQEEVGELKKVKSRFIESKIRHKQEHHYSFEVPKNKKELRVTLAWHDVPGPKLINNLDLWIRHGSDKKILPLTPDPFDPSTPAVRKRNKRDTAEHIMVKNPLPGAWTIGIKGKKIPKGAQKYALVISAGQGNEAPVRKHNGDFRILDVVASMGNVDLPVGRFNVGDPIYLHALIDVLDNASYEEGHYGTIHVRHELRDETGVLVYVLSSSLHNLAPNAPGEHRELVWREEEIPEGIQTGRFRVKTTVTMHNGISKTAPEEFWITLN